MIPGTTKEIAALANAFLSASHYCAQMSASISPTPENKARLLDTKRRLRLAERRELVAAGKLPGSSVLPHSVALAVDLVDTDSSMVMQAGSITIDPAYSPRAGAGVQVAVQRALNDTATGAYELWFDAEGNAFLSFETMEDATLFRLALDA